MQMVIKISTYKKEGKVMIKIRKGKSDNLCPTSLMLRILFYRNIINLFNIYPQLHQCHNLKHGGKYNDAISIRLR